MEKIKVECPATSANLGAGFDICGIALKEPTDTMQIGFSEKDEIISKGFSVTTSLEQNVCYAVLQSMRKEFEIKEKFRIEIEKRIPVASGLGSSAASSAGTAFAINKLCKLELCNEELVRFASEGEVVSSGSPHLDNVSPAIFGGFTITYSNSPVKIVKFSAPKNLEVGLILSNKKKESTKFARSILPEQVSREDAEYNKQKLSQLVVGFMEKDIEVIISAMEDKIVEPAREKAGILPHFSRIKEIGKNFGYGIAASGAGPTIAALGKMGKSQKKKFEEEILRELRELDGRILWTEVSGKGVVVIE